MNGSYGASPMFVRIASLFFVCFFAQMVVAQTASFAPSASALLPGQLPRLTRSGGVIYRCLFDSASDALDSDSWPDYWSRKTGIEQGIQFPEYLDIALVQRDSPFSGGALRMDIRGGAAAVFSPKIPVRAGMSYTISVYFLAEKLVHSNVSLIVSFYGSEGAAPLKSVMSPAEKNTRGWRKIAVGPLHADVLDVQAISVGLLVLPKERNDFEGLVEWTNLEIRESPTIELQTPVENNIFSDVSQVTIDCRVTGIDPAQHTVLFSLEDAQGRVIATKETDVLIGNRPASQIVIAGDKPENVYVASAKWEKLPLVSPGFYRVRMATPKAFIQSLPPNPDQFFEDPFTHTKPITLAVLASAAASSAHFLPNGEFGWSLDGWSHEQIQSQVNLLRKSGISRLKLPVWFEENATAQDRDRFSELCEVLAQQNLDLVGLLTPIPKSVRDQIRYVSPDARAVFSLEPRVWSDGLQQTLQDLSLLIQDWQWTADDDVSLQNVPNFEANFDSWKAAFDRQEFGLGIGLAWDWNAELPRQFAQQMPSQSANTPENPATRDDRDFVALTSANPLTPDEMGAFLAGSAESGNMVSANSASDNPVTSLRRFVTLSPLSRNDYELEERIRDFVRRMVIAKASGVEAIFLEKPIDEDRGVLLSDLTPTELFLPWRTTANMLSGRNFLGSVDMPQGSRNFCFEADGGKAVMVLWNDEATEETAMGGGPVLETLFLGEKVEGQDVWGKTFIPELQGHEQVIPVGTLPIFVTGLDANIVRFRASFELGSPPPESGDLGNNQKGGLYIHEMVRGRCGFRFRYAHHGSAYSAKSKAR